MNPTSDLPLLNLILRKPVNYAVTTASWIGSWPSRTHETPPHNIALDLEGSIIIRLADEHPQSLARTNLVERWPYIMPAVEAQGSPMER